MRHNDEARQDAKAQFLTALQATMSVTHAARAAGISRKTAYRWRDEDQEFAEAWAEAREAAIDDLEASAFEQAKSGKSPALVIYLLKCHRPERYREPGRGRSTTHTGRPVPSDAPTLESIFGEELADLDLGSQKAWGRIAQALGALPIQDVTSTLVRISDQLLKIGVVQRQGASSSALDEIRRMAREVIGEADEASWDGEGEANDDED
jgi:hypothetical protein